MNKIIEDAALNDIAYWAHEDRKIFDKIFSLIRDIDRNGAAGGKGSPKRLRHYPGWSRRIDRGNRLIYKVDGDDLHIISCRGHYDD